MYLQVLLLGIALLISSCSSNQKGKPKSSSLDDIPFEQLQTVRILPSFVSDKIDPKELYQTVLEQFAKIGIIHTPDDTSLQKLLVAQEKPFAILLINVREIATSDEEKVFPIMSISCRMDEKTTLSINQKEWMSTVWEKTEYIEILPDPNVNTAMIKQKLSSLAQEFFDRYYAVNPKSTKPEFYISGR